MPKSGPREGVEGVVEDLKGKAKEVVGELRDDPRLRREGEAQQEKARRARSGRPRGRRGPRASTGQGPRGRAGRPPALIGGARPQR